VTANVQCAGGTVTDWTPSRSVIPVDPTRKRCPQCGGYIELIPHEET
jgi:uncharacterized protein with PIN domain